MKNTQLHQITAFFFTLLLCVTTWAAPPATSPYVTDPQNAYVQDATSQGIGNVNMILCIMNAMNVSGSGMLNKGSYIALVDMNKCKAQGGGGGSTSTSSGASASTNFMTALVDATRASSTTPMISNIWMSMTEQGVAQDIYIKVTATSSPSDVPPYGVFRMDYIGFPAGTTATANMNGYIDSSSSTLQYYETETSSGRLTQLSMSAGSTTTGSGSMHVMANNNGTMIPADYNFYFNSNNFRRSDLTNDQCFDRALANADKSVWQYGTYNANDGTRVDMTNPSFQVLATQGANKYYGYASYYGINFQGLDVTSIADASPISGLTVTDQRPNNTTTYNLSKVGGKLTKWTKNTTTLGAMDGIPFTFFGDMTNQTTAPNAVLTAIGTGGSFQNWQMQWNSNGANAGKFTVNGVQSCSNTGCNTTTFTDVPVVGSNFNTAAISGWSNSFGGSINIPSAGRAHIAGDSVSYFTQSLVIPGSASAPTTLFCLSNCPDVASIAAANTGAAATSPFNATTANQWFNAPTNVNVSYTFGSNGLMIGTTPMTITNATYFTNNTMYSFGVQSGNLYDTAFTACPGGSPFTGLCQPSDPAAYYTWQTGTNQWSQSLWLTNAATSAVIAFDPPQNVSYTIPTGTTYGTWAGKTIMLQFNGFGNLQGIPGHCVNPVDNTVVTCSTPNVRYVPEFSIPDAGTMTLGSTPLIVKALNAEIRLKNLGPGNATPACSGMTLATQPLPSASGLHNMSNPTDAFWLGNKATPASSTPKVIDGVVQ